MVALAAITFIMYSTNINNPLLWDDEDWIVRNPFVHELSIQNLKSLFTKNTLAGIGEKSNYYRPVLFVTFLFNYVFQGDSPASYHIISNLLHAGNAILIYLLVLMLFKKKSYAFLVALFFAIHPLQTEAVTYISGRGDPLSVFFILLGILVFLRYRKRFRWALFAFVVIFEVLAILSREVAATMPFFLLLLEMFLQLKERPFLQSLRLGIWRTAPFFAVAGLYGLLRLTVFNFKDTLNFYVANNIYTENLSYRIFTFFNALLDYVRLVFVPIGLHMERDVPLRTSLLQWPVWFVGLGLLCGLCALIWLYRRDSSMGRNNFRLWFLGLGWFFIWLGPSSGIVPVNARIYEHWLYFSLFGAGLLIMYYVDRLFGSVFIQKEKFVRYGIIALLLAYAGFFIRTGIQRNYVWADAERLYKDILIYDPGNVRIHNNLGNVYFKRGDVDQAQAEYQAAVDGEDIFPQPHFNLGSILQDKKDIAGAIAEYQKSIELDPDFPFGYQGLAVLYAQQGNFTKALEYYQKLLKLRPDDPRAYYNIALVRLTLKQNAEALDILQQGLPYATQDLEAQDAIRSLIDQLKTPPKKK